VAKMAIVFEVGGHWNTRESKVILNGICLARPLSVRRYQAVNVLELGVMDMIIIEIICQSGRYNKEGGLKDVCT